MMNPNNVQVGDFTMNTESGRMGVVEWVAGDRSMVEVRMRDDESLVEVDSDEFSDWK